MNNEKLQLEDAPEYIYLKADGNLACESIFGNNFDGNLDLLVSIVEDNIYDYVDGERIDWSRVYPEYNMAMGEKRSNYAT